METELRNINSWKIFTTVTGFVFTNDAGDVLGDCASTLHSHRLAKNCAKENGIPVKVYRMAAGKFLYSFTEEP